MGTNAKKPRKGVSKKIHHSLLHTHHLDFFLDTTMVFQEHLGIASLLFAVMNNHDQNNSQKKNRVHLVESSREAVLNGKTGLTTERWPE